jgi:type II secretory pathway predicted ATPase ExeA
MFLEYYGLREQPFGVTPDPSYLYFSEMHREALASLFYGIETGCGFLTLIAPPGTGKTTLLIHLLERLRKSAKTVFLFQTQCDSREFFRYLLTDLGVDASTENMAHMHESLNSVLVSNARSGKRFVLVIDEAQNLKRSVLETVRLLSDFETAGSKLMQIVLCGQPQLADKLSHPDLTQLRQRISIISRLQPFAKPEVPQYISHRLKVAGYAGAGLFDADALSEITAHSDGIPRIINNICFNALTLGYAKSLEQIDGSTVSEVLADLDMDALRSPSATASMAAQDFLSSSVGLDRRRVAQQEPYYIARTARTGVGAPADPQAQIKSAPVLSADEVNFPGVVSGNEACDLAAVGSTLENKAAPAAQDHAVNQDTVRTISPDRVVRQVPNLVNMPVEQTRTVTPEALHSAGLIWSEMHKPAGKHQPPAREWFVQPPGPEPVPSAQAGSESLVGNGHRPRTNNSEVVHEEFCGLRIDKIRETIRSQVPPDDPAESESSAARRRVIA